MPDSTLTHTERVFLRRAQPSRQAQAHPSCYDRPALQTATVDTCTWLLANYCAHKEQDHEHQRLQVEKCRHFLIRDLQDLVNRQIKSKEFVESSLIGIHIGEMAFEDRLDENDK